MLKILLLSHQSKTKSLYKKSLNKLMESKRCKKWDMKMICWEKKFGPLKKVWIPINSIQLSFFIILINKIASSFRITKILTLLSVCLIKSWQREENNRLSSKWRMMNKSYLNWEFNHNQSQNLQRRKALTLVANYNQNHKKLAIINQKNKQL